MSAAGGLECRRASVADYLRIMSIDDNIYNGRDYLPTLFFKFLANPRRFLYVGQIDEEIVSVSFFIGYLHMKQLSVRPGVRIPVGTVYISSFPSFARDSKWGYRLLMTSRWDVKHNQPTLSHPIHLKVLVHS